MVIGGWVAAVAVVAGAATLGGRTSPETVRERPAGASPAASVVVPERSIRIDQPARSDEVVRTREVVVRGQVTKGVSRVWVTLESGGRPISTRSIDPIGVPQNDQVPFETRFKVDRPRPAGPLFVIVVAIGDGGVPIDAMRRRFSLGESLELGGSVRSAVPTG